MVLCWPQKNRTSCSLVRDVVKHIMNNLDECSPFFHNCSQVTPWIYINSTPFSLLSVWFFFCRRRMLFAVWWQDPLRWCYNRRSGSANFINDEDDSDEGSLPSDYDWSRSSDIWTARRGSDDSMASTSAVHFGGRAATIKSTDDGSC